jgi:hypothetical protein
MGALVAQKAHLLGVVISGPDTVRGVFQKKTTKSGELQLLFRQPGSQEFKPLEPQFGRIVILHQKALYTSAFYDRKLAFFETVALGTYARLLRQKQAYYIEMNDSVIALLEERLQMNGSQIIKKTFLGTLAKAMADCPAVFGQINATSLYESDLTKLLTSYNQCRGGTTIVFRQTVPVPRKSVRILGGLTVTSFRGRLGREEFLLGNRFVYFSDRTVYQPHPTFGVGLDLPIQRVNQRISFSPEFRFSSFTEQAVLRSEQLGYDVNSVTIRNSFLSLPMLLSYRFSSLGEKGLFMKAGLLASYNLIASYKNVATRSVSPTAQPKIDESLRLQTLQYGFVFGTGYALPLKRFPLQFEMRYEHYGPFTDNAALTLTKSSVMFLFSYSFQ